MQTDILLKQVISSLNGLKTAIDKFEKHPSPSTDYAEQLHTAMNETNKLVAAYVVLKEHKDISPELNLHLKIMSAQETKPDPVKEIHKEEIKEDAKPIEPVEKKPNIEPVINLEKEKILETPIASPAEIVTNSHEHNSSAKLVISINDKFRFINELFAANVNEYNIAIEQLNTVNTLEEANAYLKGLKSIYNWDEENEQVKKLFSLNGKRFS